MIDLMRKILFFLLLSISLQALNLKDENGELIPPAKELLALLDVPSDLTLDQLIPYLKQNWLLPNKERWEMGPMFEEKRDLAFPLLKEIGCIHTVHAQKSHYDYALVLGAMEKAMQRRLDFLYEEWQRGIHFDEIVLLTGERDLDPERESFPEELKTETDLFIYLLERHPLKECAPFTVINSPKQKLINGQMRRPNTASTIIDWFQSNPRPGSCLAISTQPFVGYQEAVVQFFLSSEFTVEAIGPGTDFELGTPNPSYPLSVYLNNFAKWLIYEHLMEFQCEKLSSKSLSDSTRRDRMDQIETAHRSHRHSPHGCRT